MIKNLNQEKENQVEKIQERESQVEKNQVEKIQMEKSQVEKGQERENQEQNNQVEKIQEPKIQEPKIHEFRKHAHKRQLSLNKRRLSLILLGVVFCVALLPMLPVRTKAASKIVRVGWHEEPYFIKDQNGRASGYSYEYQQKVAAYLGWEYDYVEGTWAELTQKLKDGEIDLLANVSYSEDRAKDFLFASLPMGTESYYLCVSPSNQDISSTDYHSLDGKKVGIS